MVGPVTYVYDIRLCYYVLLVSTLYLYKYTLYHITSVSLQTL